MQSAASNKLMADALLHNGPEKGLLYMTLRVREFAHIMSMSTVDCYSSRNVVCSFWWVACVKMNFTLGTGSLDLSGVVILSSLSTIRELPPNTLPMRKSEAEAEQIGAPLGDGL
jgi:hypothetical protein